MRYKSPILIVSAFSTVQPALAFSIISSLFSVAVIPESRSYSSLAGLFQSDSSGPYFTDASKKRFGYFC